MLLMTQLCHTTQKTNYYYKACPKKPMLDIFQKILSQINN